MSSEVKRRMEVSNAVPSNERGSENTPTATSLGSYWGNTNISKQDIIQCRVVCIKIKRGSEGSRDRDVHHKNATSTLPHNFGAAKNFVPRNL